MSREDVQRFYEAITKDEALQKKFTVLNEIPAEDQKEDTIARQFISLAKEAGFVFTPEELKEYSNTQKKSLSTEELAAVTGGIEGNMIECICVAGGGGVGYHCTCACVGYGMGLQTDVYPHHDCYCVLGGYGALVKE